MENTQQFDYSKYEEHPSWSSESLADPKYWGMHEIDGKLVIDVERYKKTCDDIGITDFIPQCFKDQDIKFSHLPNGEDMIIKLIFSVI